MSEEWRRMSVRKEWKMKRGIKGDGGGDKMKG